jgi:hypothetical protein
MGSTFEDVGSALGFGGPNKGAYDGQINDYQSMLNQRANDPNGIATMAYKKMANEGMGNTIAGIAQTKGLRAPAAATMADITGSRMQGQIADQAGVMGLTEQQQNQNALGNLLMQRNAQDLQQQSDQQKRLSGTLGMGLTAAGYAFGGPAGGMAAQEFAAPSGGGSLPGSTAPTNMGMNPFEGAAPYVAPNPYNRGSFSQGLQFNSGF